jgi:hypothetical protein
MFQIAAFLPVISNHIMAGCFRLNFLHGLSLHAYGGKQKLDSTSFLIEKWKCLALNNPAFRDLYNTNH